ncbi:DUF1510 family protein [Ornithinibacillus sp. 179-J 7C1 HS]|uniref:YrrS family protein n=1 Tax=Ornithinibacillus sp. 179-J 7C1 HS TaxID=3142384 RepID=UPI0039A06770
MSNFDRYSRVNKFEKRRKNTKLMSILIVAASFLVIILLGLWIFGPDDEPNVTEEISSPNNEPEEDENKSTEVEDTDSEQGSTSTEDSSSGTEDNTSDQTEQGDTGIDSNENVETETTEPVATDDDNVVSAYTGDWQPVGTEQVGPHTTQFDTESIDWKEMEKAIRSATGLTEEDMITWFIGNGGHQKAIGTVTNKAQTEIYRVYLSWVDNQGWQPTLVEILKENDKD